MIEEPIEGRSIDLIRTFEKFRSRSNAKALWKDSFADQLIDLSLGVISTYNREDDLLGIRRCFAHLIRTLKRKQKILYFFKMQEEIGDSIAMHKSVDLIVDSLIYTIIAFQDQLKVHYLGQTRNTLTKLHYGLELVCIWAANGVSLSPDENDCVVLIDRSKFVKNIF